MQYNVSNLIYFIRVNIPKWTNSNDRNEDPADKVNFYKDAVNAAVYSKNLDLNLSFPNECSIF